MRSLMTSPTSPTIGTSAARFLLISAGSMSAWITLAPGAKVESWPVTRSSKRAPSAMMRSERCRPVTAATVPCMPGMPRLSVVAVGHRAARHERRDDRDAGQVDEAAQLLARAGPHDAAADVEHRSLRLGHEAARLADLLAVRPGHRAVAGQVDLRRPAEGRHRLQGVLADVDEHGAGPAGARDVEGLGDGLRDLGRVGDEVVVLRDRHRDAADVGLLEGVGADGSRSRPAR